MATYLTVAEYLDTAETNRRQELVYGVLREPPAPAYGHQDAVTRLVSLFYAHVEHYQLGRVCVSPVDVVLDSQRDLVLQPDIVFVSRARAEIIRDRIWGSPDLVVEVLSPSTRYYDRRTKLEWYQQYGVRECWLVDQELQSIEVVTCSPPPVRRATFSGEAAVRSDVLPDWTLPANRHFL